MPSDKAPLNCINLCRFDLLKVTSDGVKPVCRDLDGKQLVDLIEELKNFGVVCIAKFTGFRATNQVTLQ